MPKTLPISDKYELLALYRALWEAKFNPHPTQRELQGSPFVANLINQVAAMLDAEGLAIPGETPAAAHPREWEIALTRACETTQWAEWDHDTKVSYARDLLAPVASAADHVERFIGLVDAQQKRPDEAPPSDDLLGDLLVVREYDLKVPGEPDDGVQVRIGVPHSVPSRVAYYCRFQVVGLSRNKVRAAYGVDALQALELAMQMAMAVVRSSAEARAGRLYFPGDSEPDLDTQSLRLIGYWRSDDEPEWPDPKDFVDQEWDERERDIVVSHLQDGRAVWAQCGLSPCRFCGKPNGSAELSDGVYIWPEGLAHYLVEHGVRLPQEFVDHVNAQCDALEQTRVDSTWWRRVTPREG
ncbi:MAG: hypothetical protein OXU20_07535 [Myxococcales bacterium]|nr:hypothetical protein [Myxococcales bacterium]MDD9966516.1 hypothetical protein [Myxococcales bacterium]